MDGITNYENRIIPARALRLQPFIHNVVHGHNSLWHEDLSTFSNKVAAKLNEKPRIMSPSIQETINDDSKYVIVNPSTQKEVADALKRAG